MFRLDPTGDCNELAAALSKINQVHRRLAAIPLGKVLLWPSPLKVIVKFFNAGEVQLARIEKRREFGK